MGGERAAPGAPQGARIRLGGRLSLPCAAGSQRDLRQGLGTGTAAEGVFGICSPALHPEQPLWLGLSEAVVWDGNGNGWLDSETYGLFFWWFYMEPELDPCRSLPMWDIL